MFFYEVAPASRQFHGRDLLTYSSPERLIRGQIIVVKIRNKSSLAFVLHEVSKPEFKTVGISEYLESFIPEKHLELFEWLREYYPAPVGLIGQLFLPLGSAKDYQMTGTAAEEKPKPVTAPPALTEEQLEAVGAAQLYPTVLLHGDTGTGKTRVYIELALKAIEEGKSVLVLVPEIALSPQIVKTFETHIPVPVNVTHSGLTGVQRRKTWQRISAHDGPQVVIGPRSALFTPLGNVGLVVMDEFHEPAYKQDQAPYYQTLRAASRFARLHDAHFVMGSATPPVSEYFVAEQKKVPIIRMIEKAVRVESEKPNKLNTHIVSLREESERGRYPLITNTLISEIKEALGRREQILLFLNKRGSARVILCQNCGWHALCEHCDLPLTYHGDTHKLQCHTCGRHQPAPTVCPECSSHDIMFKSPGTKAIVDAVTHIFPEARIARFDRDNKKSERLDMRHGEIVRGDIDILVGTQLLAKGHDLPRLSLVGILLAENELQFPDYTSGERSYQLVHQLIGRVGRGHRSGHVVVQTYDPESMAVKTAVGLQTWDEFYKAQIKERELFEFPPFYYMMKIEVSRAKLDTVTATCQQIMDFISGSGEPVKIIGPAPSFIEKRGGTWNWQIIVKARQRTALTRLATTIPQKCTINLDPSNLL